MSEAWIVIAALACESNAAPPVEVIRPRSEPIEFV